MSVQACADIVAKGDPDRFAAAMAAPVEARQVLFPLYAFNVEIAHAPWVTQEPMIAEMRLQWWRDALEEIGRGGPVRMHEVATPLAKIIGADGAAILDRLVQSRRWDVYRDGFKSENHFSEYLDATGGGLMWASALTLGADRTAESSEADAEKAVRRFGRATAFVRFMQAVPALTARGCKPLLDAGVETITAFARFHLSEIEPEKALWRALAAAARPALLESWQTHPLLRQIARDPSRVAAGRVGLSPIRKKLRLLRWS